MTGSTVEIGQIDALYVVPADHPAPQQIRWQLDRVGRTRLAAALERTLADVLDPADDVVCVIDELAVEVALDVEGSGEDVLAAGWADAITAALRAAVDAPGTDGAVRRFANRSEQLAAFLVDVADGRAWERGWYAAFAGLQALPSEAAIREALERDPPTARAALAVLAREGRLDRVLGALTERSAERVVGVLAEGRSATAAGVEAAASAWPRVLRGRHDVVASDALRLVDWAAPTADLATLIAAARTLVAIARAADGRRDLLERALSGALEPTGVDAELAGLVEPAGVDPALVRQLAELLEPRDLRPSAGRVVASAYSGVFLLLRGLLDLDVDHILEPLAGPQVPIESLRLALLTRIVGAPGAAGDPGVRFVAGVGAEDPPEEPGDGTEAQRRLAASLAHLGRADGRAVVLEPIEAEDPRKVLVRDAAHGAWLAFLDERDAATFVSHIFGRAPETVERSAGSMDELTSFGGVPDALSLLARAAVRELAVRLPGLGRSSASYLRQNFLSGPGMIRVDSGAIEAVLPATPLRVVLQLAGVDRSTVAVPWLGEVTLVLPGT